MSFAIAFQKWLEIMAHNVINDPKTNLSTKMKDDTDPFTNIGCINYKKYSYRGATSDKYEKKMSQNGKIENEESYLISHYFKCPTCDSRIIITFNKINNTYDIRPGRKGINHSAICTQSEQEKLDIVYFTEHLKNFAQNEYISNPKAIRSSIILNVLKEYKSISSKNSIKAMPVITVKKINRWIDEVVHVGKTTPGMSSIPEKIRTISGKRWVHELHDDDYIFLYTN